MKKKFFKISESVQYLFPSKVCNYLSNVIIEIYKKKRTIEKVVICRKYDNRCGELKTEITENFCLLRTKLIARRVKIAKKREKKGKLLFFKNCLK